MRRSLSAPADVRWASGFTSPDDGKVVVTRDAAVLITDGRYTVQAAQESGLEVRMIAGRTWLDVAVDVLAGATAVVQADHLTWHAARTLEGATSSAPVAAVDLTRPLRIVKTAREQERLREAARLTDAAFAFVLEGALRPGVREVDVALALERFVREAGGDRMAFDAIVAGGPRSAMPHGVASARLLERGDLVTLDFGAVVDGYHAGHDPVGGARTGGRAAARLGSTPCSTRRRRPSPRSGPACRGSTPTRSRATASRRRAWPTASSTRSATGRGSQIHEGPSLSVRSKDVLAARHDRHDRARRLRPGRRRPAHRGPGAGDRVRPRGAVATRRRATWSSEPASASTKEVAAPSSAATASSSGPSAYTRSIGSVPLARNRIHRFPSRSSFTPSSRSTSTTADPREGRRVDGERLRDALRRARRPAAAGRAARRRGATRPRVRARRTARRAAPPPPAPLRAGAASSGSRRARARAPRRRSRRTPRRRSAPRRAAAARPGA